MSAERLFKPEASAKNEPSLHPCIMKISAHHRALYCYFLLSLWIFLLVAGMYKYMGVGINGGFISSIDDSSGSDEYHKNPQWDVKMRRILRVCNPPALMGVGSEAHVDGNQTLEGVIIFLRHGDRGPMSHVKNISNVNCAADLIENQSLENNPSYPAFQSFIANLSAQGAREKFLGRFSEFLLSPPIGGKCQLGQLTPVGLAQMLQLGRLLKSIYGDKLGITNNSLTKENTQLYTTRYRRTVQSTVAFLTSFLGPEQLSKMSLQESFSVAFCFDDCACPAADTYAHKFAAERSNHFHAHPAVVNLVANAAPLVYDSLTAPLTSDPHALRDAVLAYVCHGAQLPCIDSTCLKLDTVTGLFAYTEWEARQYGRSGTLRRGSLLRAYGALRNLGTHILSLISERRPRLVLYSGHDMTLQYLTAALGVLADGGVSPHYASRLIFEVYREDHINQINSLSTSPRDFSFRLVYNGRDVTSRVPFCHKGPLCPIESIVRFLHDDYFLIFNATNFKDACGPHTS